MVPKINLDNDMYPKFNPKVDNYVPIECKYYDYDILQCSVPKSALNLLMCNVRSCKKNFCNLFSCFSNILTYFTCIILVETWLTKDRDISYSIPGFCSHEIYRDQFGGGIKMYVKDGVRARVVNDFTFLNNLFEVLTVEIIINGKKLFCSAAYHPPSSSHVNNNDFVLSFTSFLRSVLGHHIPAVICGDFNINLINPNKYVYIDSFVNGMFELGLNPLITIPTKINLDNPITKFSLLDHIWVSSGENAKQSFVIPIELTDHFPVGVSLDSLPTSRSAQVRQETRFLSDRGKFTFKLLLNNFVFTFLGGNINQVFDSYFNRVFDLYERAFPLTKALTGTKETAPWLTSKLKQCIKKKAKLYKLYLKGKVTKLQYVCFRNKVTNVLRRAKRLYYMKKFFEAGKNSGMIWSCLNGIMGKKKSVSLERVEVDGIIVTGQHLANHANDYFVTAAASLVSGMVLPLTYIFFTPPVLASCFLYPATWVEVQIIIKGLKNKGNKVLDISTQILKDNDVLFSRHFAILYNLSIDHKEYPDSLKIARVTPVHKAGSPCDMDNYRPISVLPTISKIFEKLTLNRLESFISTQALLSPCQFGFRRCRSTTHAILTLLSYIQTAYHKKIFCVCFFLDLRKAFDTVSHHIL